MTQAQTKTDRKIASTATPVKQTEGVPEFAPVLAPQFAQFWQAQESILTEFEAFSRAWFARRHQATKLALETTREVAGNGALDSSLALRAIAEWNRGSFGRIVEDVQEWMRFCTQCTSHLAEAETQAGPEEPETTGKRTSGAEKPEHATPA